MYEGFLLGCKVRRKMLDAAVACCFKSHARNGVGDGVADGLDGIVRTALEVGYRGMPFGPRDPNRGRSSHPYRMLEGLPKVSIRAKRKRSSGGFLA